MSGRQGAQTFPFRRLGHMAAMVLKRATINFVEDRCTHMAAAISFFGLFALFPITTLTVSLFGVVLRDADIQATVLQAIVSALPVEETSVEESLRSVAELGPTLTVVSMVGAVWSASVLSTVVRRSINVVFDVDRPRPLLRAKIVDYSLLPLVGLLFLGSFLLTAIWRLVERTAGQRFTVIDEHLTWLSEVGTLSIAAVLSFLTFLFLYWLLPNRQVNLRHIWPGALLAALGIQLAQHGFALYLSGFANYDVVYGSLAGVFALLFWVYLSANILLFGAEVAAEIPHVLSEAPRHGHTAASDVSWQASLMTVLRGLILVPGGDTGPTVPSHTKSEASKTDPT